MRLFVSCEGNHSGSSDSQSPGSSENKKKGRCPRCGTEFQYTSISDHKPFPFCSSRCRDVDLGNWLSGNYAIPGEPIKQTPPQNDDEDYDGT